MSFIDADGDKSPFSSKSGSETNHSSESATKFVADSPHDHQIGPVITAVNIFKGTIGTGVLGLPFALKRSGILLGVLSLAFISLLTLQCMHLLVICSRFISTKKKLLASCDYGQVARRIVSDDRVKLAFFFELITNIFIILTQLGFLCVYVLFVTATLQRYITFLSNEMLTMFLFVILLAITSFTNIRMVASFSCAATIIQSICLIVLLIYLGVNMKPIEDLPWFGELEDLPLFFGTAMFAFEGIAVVLPLENAMRKPHRFFFVLDIAMGLVTLVYISVGFFGYAAFQNDVKGSVTMNLPLNIFSHMIQFGYAIAIILSYPIQFFVPMEIIQGYLIRNVDSSSIDHRRVLIWIRVFLVFLTCVATIAIPHIEDLFSLSGSLTAATISLVLPPLIHMACFWNNGLTRTQLAMDIFLVCFGVLGCVVGTITSLHSLINKKPVRHPIKNNLSLKPRTTPSVS